MKVLIYQYENMVRAGEIMHKISAQGIENFRLLKELGDILDSGISGDYTEKKDGDGDGMERQEVQQNKLEK